LATVNPTLKQSADLSAGDTDLNRRVLTLIGSFRLIVAAAILLVAVLQTDPIFLGGRYPLLFITTACVYCFGSVTIALVLRGEQAHTRQLAWLQLVVDIACITLIVHASGGIGSGLEALLVVFVVASAMTLSARSSYLAAAIAALAVLLEQSLSFLQGTTTAAQFIPAGVIGAIMLVLTLAIQPIVRRVGETTELARQRGIDLENLAQLNDYIIQNLREAIIVVDERQTIRLINQAAAEQLGRKELQAGDQLGKASPEIHELLQTWQANELELAPKPPSFMSADRSTVINAHFAPLGDPEESGGKGPVLIFLEDAGLLEEKVQQSKLAALGRLSASIAHEIRNPIGALSHAGQLLRESQDIGEQDKRFLDIIQTNSKRVSQIVDNILQLSRKDAVNARQLELEKWANDFVNEFVSTLELFEGQLSIVDSENVEVRVDPGHLHQVTWNLCENAVKYASETAGAIAVELRYGRLSKSGRPFLEISDHGPGIPPELEDTVFEPFATGRMGGTGLGLYICRELCQRNGGSLRYRSREGGGSIFQVVFADPGRWDA
jgi:two-component system sensor histidine kinase PilS (NtrC family)